MNENQIATAVIQEAITIHKTLGPGLLESVYEIIIDHELRSKGFDSKRQVPVPFRYKNIELSRFAAATIH